MLVYKEDTSTVTMMLSGGRRVGRDWIMTRKWLVSWIWEGRNYDSAYESYSTIASD